MWWRSGTVEPVAGALDASAFGSALVQAVLPLSMPQALQAFDALSGEIHASERALMFEDSGYLRQAVLGRLRSASYLGGGAEMAAVCPDLVDRLVLVAPLGLWLDHAPIPDVFSLLPYQVPGLLFGDSSVGAPSVTSLRTIASTRRSPTSR